MESSKIQSKNRNATATKTKFNKSKKKKDNSNSLTDKLKLEEEINLSIAKHPVSKQDVTFSHTMTVFFDLKMMMKSPVSYLLTILLSVLISGCLALCVFLIVYGSALIYATHIQQNLGNDLQKMLDILKDESMSKGKPWDNFNFSGIFAVALVSGGLSALIQDYIHEFYKFVDYSNGLVYIGFKDYQVTLLVLAVVISTLFIIILSLYYIQTALASHISNATTKRLRTQLARKLLFHDYSFYIDNNIDSVIETFVNGPSAVGHHIKNCSSIKLNIFTTVIFVSLILGYYDIKFALINVVIVVSITCISYIGTVITTRTIISKGKSDYESEFAMAERIILARHIKSSGTWEQEFKESVSEIISRKIKKMFISFSVSFWGSIVLISIMSLVFLTGAIGAIYFTDTTRLLSVFTAFISGALVIVGQLYPLQTYSSDKQIAKAHLRAISAICLLDIEIDKYANVGKKFSVFRNKIEFKNVVFAYPDEPEKIMINKLNLTILKGQKIGVAGQSGCGKTTLAKLLLGYYKPLSGEILIDGVPLNSYNLQSWLSNVAYIDQSPQLLTMSVFENLVYGTKKFTSQDVFAACKKARIHDLIMSWPDRYNTILEDGGSRLSGGQKQRFTIARMLIKKADLIILDEATSKLDTITELEIMEELVSILKQEKLTCLSISHKIKSLVGFDLIVKMAPKIGIVTSGRYEDLVKVKESLSFLNPLEYEIQKKRTQNNNFNES